MKYSDLIEDFRAATKQVMPGCYYPVTYRHSGFTSRVLQLSIWDDDDDAELADIVVDVPSRAMKDSTAYFINSCRDLMIPIRVPLRGRGKLLIEARPHALRMLRRRLGIDEEALERAIIGGGLTAVFSKRTDALERRYKRRTKKLLGQAETAESRRSQTRQAFEEFQRDVAEERSKLSGDMSRAAERLRDSQSRNHALEQQRRAMRELILAHGLQLPPGC